MRYFNLKLHRSTFSAGLRTDPLGTLTTALHRTSDSLLDLYDRMGMKEKEREEGKDKREEGQDGPRKEEQVLPLG